MGRSTGRAILQDGRNIRAARYPDGLPTGGAVITTAGRMPAGRVIHTVGPVYGSGGPDKAYKLARCYANSLRIAAEEGLATVAFPAISTGVYGYPADEAAAVSSRAIQDALGSHPSIREVRLVFFLPRDADGFVRHQAFGAE